jgi:hypothetical protein
VKRATEFFIVRDPTSAVRFTDYIFIFARDGVRAADD